MRYRLVKLVRKAWTISLKNQSQIIKSWVNSSIRISFNSLGSLQLLTDVLQFRLVIIELVQSHIEFSNDVGIRWSWASGLIATAQNWSRRFEGHFSWTLRFYNLLEFFLHQILLQRCGWLSLVVNFEDGRRREDCLKLFTLHSKLWRVLRNQRLLNCWILVFLWWWNDHFDVVAVVRVCRCNFVWNVQDLPISKCCSNSRLFFNNKSSFFRFWLKISSAE